MNLDAELQALAAQEDVPSDLLRRLLQHPGARRQVALRQDLTEPLIEEIIGLGSARTLAANSSLPAVVRARLADHPQTEVRAALAANAADDPPGLLAQLSQDTEPFVREFLAMNENLDPLIRARLAADPEPRVRAGIIRHWRDAPEQIRRALLTDPEADVRRAAAEVYALPLDLLPGLLADRDTRAAAVLYAEPAADMATDPDAGVREAVAGHPALPVTLREPLAQDIDAPGVGVPIIVVATGETQQIAAETRRALIRR